MALYEENEALSFEFNRFIKFGEVLDQKTRVYFVSYLKQKIYPEIGISESLNSSYFKEFSEALELLFNNEELQAIFDKHQNISEQIALDILHWFRKTFAKMSKQHPFEEEQIELESWAVRPMKIFVKTWRSLVQKMGSYYTEDELNFKFYEKKFIDLIDSQQVEESHKAKISEIEYVFTDALGAWDANLQAKILDYQVRHLKEKIQDFKTLLEQKVAEFSKLNQLVKPFEDYAGNYWDMSRSLWEKAKFEELFKYNSILENEAAIKKLADMLGKMREAEIETEEEIFEKISIHKSWVKDHNQKTEINDLKLGNDLSNVYASQLSLLSDKSTEDIFYDKLVAGKLLQLAYEDDVLTNNPLHTFEVNQKSKLKEKGPFIVCVDTSGSMEGESERIAKVLCFAIMKMAAKDNRKAFLINFSSGVKTINLQNIAKSIDALAGFLRFSFHGGTDISLALHEALRQLEEKDYKEADVLVISDFLMYKIEQEILEKMQFQQDRKGSRFHSLIISDEPSAKVIEKFDNVWQYDPEEKGVIKQLYLHLNQINRRKI